MRKVILFIAMSADGYIAKEDGDISFLSAVESPGEDYGYSEFVLSVDTVIMGRKTYDKVLSFGIGWPHQDKKSYIITCTKRAATKDVEFYSDSVKQLILRLKNEPGKDIYCDGGAELVKTLMKEELIDRYIVSIIPVMLGGGIKLFEPGRAFEKLKLNYSRSFPSGLVQLSYDKV